MIATLMPHINKGTNCDDHIERCLRHREVVLTHFAGDREMVIWLEAEPQASSYVELLYDAITNGRASSLLE